MFAWKHCKEQLVNAAVHGNAKYHRSQTRLDPLHQALTRYMLKGCGRVGEAHSVKGKTGILL